MKVDKEIVRIGKMWKENKSIGIGINIDKGKVDGKSLRICNEVGESKDEG